MTATIRRQRFFTAVICTVTLGTLVSCSGGDLPASVDGSASAGGDSSTPRALPVTITVADSTPTRMFDRRLLGTNVPAWIGADRLADPEFRAATIGSGTSLLRMPGGSWSNAYNWSACELRDPERCVFPDAARPSDFVDFLEGTQLPAIWTVSINETAQSAAAAVAFFNGSVDDTTEIGVDRNGVGWGTVGLWAQVRADGGHPDPVGIELWEVGNEVYGGSPESGGEACATYGWEDVWTCDGVVYVEGDDLHDGYASIRSAMRAVDSTIEVGAVGTGDPDQWSNWGNDVVAAAGDDLDFYVVHQYGFDESPTGPEALARPSELWPGIVAGVRGSLGSDVPIAVTEYNLVSVEAGDTEHTMTQSMNALYVADTIGQLAELGVPIANQWDLANGTTSSGTDYGMVHLEDGSTSPQYDAMRLWSRAGDDLLDVRSDDDVVHAYGTKHDDGLVSLLILNLGEHEVDARVEFGASLSGSARLETLSTGDLSATTMDRAFGAEPVMDGALTLIIAPWSMTAIEVDADG